MSLRWALALVASVTFLGGACGGDDAPDVAAGTTAAPSSEGGGEPNPSGIPRFLEAAVAATGSHILTADNAIQAEIRVYDLAGEPVRYATPPRRVFRPDVAAVGERFLVVGAECGEYEAEPEQEPVCRPGGIAVQLYDPATDGWTVVAEDLGQGQGQQQLAAELVLAAEAHAVVHLRWAGHGELLDIDLASGEQRSLPAPSDEVAADDPEHVVAACDVAGRLAVLVARAQLAGDGPAQIFTLDEEGTGWETPVDVPIDDPGLALDVPMCTGDGFVIANPSETFVVRDGRLDVTAAVPEWSGLSAPVRYGDGFGVWMEGQLWLLGDDGGWRDGGLEAEGVLASVAVGEEIAVLRADGAEVPTLSLLPIPA